MPAKKAPAKAPTAAVKAAALTQEDYHNLRILLDRVQVTGVQEAMLLGVLGNKLNVLKGNFQPNGQDSTPAN